MPKSFSNFNLPSGCKNLLTHLSSLKSPVRSSNNELAYELKITSIRTIQRRLEVLKNLGIIKIRNGKKSRTIVIDPMFSENTVTHDRKNDPFSIQKSEEKSTKNKGVSNEQHSKTCKESERCPKNRMSTMPKSRLYNNNSSSVNLSKLKKDKEERKKRKKSSKKTSRSEVDWPRLDARGNPQISFVPNTEEHARLIKILNTTSRNPVKKDLLKKLRGTFSSIYINYRRQVQEVDGKTPSYRLPEDELKYAERAAVHCIMKGVTPWQVLKYWHKHIDNFKNSGMKIPPISFLSSAANIETVACSDLKELEKPKRKRSRFGNSFSDISQYDPRVREVLESGGFNTKKYSDKYLLSVQFAAKAIVIGVDLFIEKTMRPMAKYLAETLFKDFRKER